MSMQASDRASRMRLASKVILIVGIAAGVAIFLRASLATADPAGLQLDDTKQYMRQMELYGGKANVMASDLREWLGSLWHGKRLGATVAVLSALAAGAVRFAAIPLPPLDGGDSAESTESAD